MPVFVSEEKLGAEKRKVVNVALKVLAGFINADGCSFMLRDETLDEIEIVAAAEPDAENANKKLGIKIKVGERVAGRAVSEKKPFLIVGEVSQNRDFAHLAKYENITSGLSVPVIKNGKAIGVINAKKLTSKEVLSQQDIETVKMIAGVVAEEF